MKAVHYEGNGFCLFYKRYENGRLQWPRTGEEARQTSPSSYAGCWRA
ncbi:MAG: transposase [Lachnospiraceae bacterium]|nr:transposase [Lachnospiraceae bacterium]